MNPHGKKNVAIPERKVDVREVPSPFTFFPRNFGNFNEKFPSRGEIFVRLSPRRSITIPTNVVIIPRKRLEKWMIDPKNPRTPQSKPNPRIRPRWK